MHNSLLNVPRILRCPGATGKSSEGPDTGNLILAYNLLAALTLLAIAFAVRWWAKQMGASDWGATVAGIACALKGAVFIAYA